MVIDEYWDSIVKLQKRRKYLMSLVAYRKGCLSDLLKRVKYIDDELADLYDIYSYLKSPVPRSEIFRD